MRSKTGYILWTFICIASFFTLFMVQWCLGDEEQVFQPLFHIKLDHEFPAPEESFEEVKDLILAHYYTDEITERALYWAAIQGMLRYISPPENPDLSKIWTVEEYEKILQALHGVQVSIGIKSRFNPQDGSLTVTDVLPNSPASSVLKIHDRILRIDSQELKNRSLEEVNMLLKGEEGEGVTLTVNRDIEVFDITLKRRQFETQDLVISRLTDRLGMAEIKAFSSGISDKLKSELNTFREEGLDGLIIDLRNNSGGILSEALKVVELFLPENHILLRTVQRDTNLQNYISTNKDPFTFEIAILVNENTASSAEILAGALQDHQKAIIIGTRTYGKGVFEKTFTLKNEFRVKFITGAMYTPKGKAWQGKGITPDLLVKQEPNMLASLLKMPPKERLQRDVAIITAYKLLTHSL